MKSELNDIPQMANETRERALHYAMSIETAEKGRDDRADDLWLNTYNLAMDARGAALMTINSSLMETCPEYREEHDLAGYIDLYEDEPGVPLQKHRCDQCAGLQEMAKVLRVSLGRLWKGGGLKLTSKPEKLEEARNLHNIMLGQIHLAAGFAGEHVRTFQQEG